MRVVLGLSLVIVCSLIPCSEQTWMMDMMKSEHMKDMMKMMMPDKMMNMMSSKKMMGMMMSKNIVMGNGEKPPYQILQKIDDNVEIRKYYDTVFAYNTKFHANMSEMTDQEFQADIVMRAMKVGMYFAGCNNQSQYMPMTGLFGLNIQKAFANGSIDRSDFDSDETPAYTSAGFYVSPAYSLALPLPDSRTVTVALQPAYETAVIKFGGYPSAEDIYNYRNELVAKLGDLAEDGDPSVLTIYNYDPWWKFWDRQNEIHLYKNDLPPKEIIYGPE